MENFRASGTHTKQAHVDIPEGLYEEEHGRKGFFGRVSQLYHENPPVNWTNIDGDLKPRCLPTLFEHPETQDTLQEVLKNNDCIVSLGTLTKDFQYFYRNADYDELYFIHDGSGRLETTYGHLEFKRGDYIVMPRGTTYKFFVSERTKLLQIESNSEYEEPSRGILGPNALYDQTAKVIPEAQVGSENNLSEYIVKIKRLGKITEVSYPFNPLDVKGWKGSVYPWKLSIYDYCPIMSHRYHIPPSGHTTFVAKNFVICSFVERPLEDKKHKVLKVPFYHSNIDYDEVLFYHQGNFFSRDNIDAGALTFHPQGIHHGPHPKAFEAGDDKLYTDEYAVMIDTRYPLNPTEWFSKVENKDYWKSWM
ncbi:homogentisate 1,2-dioxygenase [Bacteriovorax sp. DB6_IX]|uniref:homogentisate 1,2-dioxygenase n=1 Tax=Bacteriovorax sp. DB6_IX TaxID=1353530 RepID=UPI000389FA88|nr:homogentisate 1,2-dioxygenase [Bacteriovorax sp. DB6_IX]EQC51223.1 putative homogentisate 1,2-dioxygenase [Bacteriovorax sp. DB6_IX]